MHDYLFEYGLRLTTGIKFQKYLEMAIRYFLQEFVNCKYITVQSVSLSIILHTTCLLHLPHCCTGIRDKNVKML